MITFVTAIMVLAAFAVVAWPLLRGVSGRPGLVQDTEVSEMLAQKDATLLAISELESDFNMGNLSQSDYRELRQRYEEKAVALIKTVDGLREDRGLGEAPSLDDEIEARVKEIRVATESPAPVINAPAPQSQIGNRRQQTSVDKSCPGCGAHLDVNDQFCFRCGAAASAKCPNCSVAVDPDDSFCSHCGAALNKGGNGRKGR